jgi:hypothetical protein
MADTVGGFFALGVPAEWPFYMEPENIFCRHCHNLTYSSQQESLPDRLMRKSRKIRKQLGGGNSLIDPFPFKPKNMHWKTYYRLRNEAEHANYVSCLIWGKQLGINILSSWLFNQAHHLHLN